MGREGGAGNPDNPEGFKTAYLWERIWRRDSLLEIIHHFIQEVDILDERGKKTGKKRLIFPRYHQLDSVRRLIADSKAQGPGRNYLIQHSAGSGKSNSIAWLAHQLAGLHDSQNKRIFDSIIVVTDRRILDRQLRDTIRSFEQVRGVVHTIQGRKSNELADALEKGKDVIVVTLQTFPFVTEKIGTLPGKCFAVIIDEAHSSQSGETAKSLKQVLAAASLEEAEKLDSAEEPDPQDEINEAVEREMKRRGRLPNVSFFAFTATPKAKTLELFGTGHPDGNFLPFSLYSMRQAIEEGFIMDVLRNYTTYKVFFSLLKKIKDDPEYERNKGYYLLRSYADLHRHGIETKTRIMLDHFHRQVRSRIGGKAKAMLVTRSRLHAVRFKMAFDKVLREEKHPYRALVAFSGEVPDPDTGERFTEQGMNSFPETQTAEEFKRDDCRFLICAEKFQTGFDQPLLHTMYVDKKLGGVQAVQTLSRLNRIHPEKEETFVLDFANKAEEIQDAFQPFYEATLLSEATDQNKLYDLRLAVEGYHLFTEKDVEDFAKVYFSKTGTQQKLAPILDRVVKRYVALEDEDEKAGFRKHLIDFVRVYAFLSQILTFTDVGLEKLYQFGRHLRRKLPVTREDLPVEIKENVNMDSYRIQETSSGDIALLKEDGELVPISELGTGKRREDEKAPLSEIIKYINDNFGTEFTTEDKVRHFADDMHRRLSEQDGLRRALDPDVNPSEETRRLAFQEFFGDTLEDMIDANFDLYKKIVDDSTFGSLFRAAMFTRIAKFFQPGARR